MSSPSIARGIRRCYFAPAWTAASIQDVIATFARQQTACLRKLGCRAINAHHYVRNVTGSSTCATIAEASSGVRRRRKALPTLSHHPEVWPGQEEDVMRRGRGVEPVYSLC